MTFQLPSRRAWLLLASVLAVADTASAAEPGAAEPAGAATLTNSTRWVIAADTSRDGQTIVTAGGDSLLYRPGEVVAWKVADGSRIGEFVGHPTAVWAVKFSADGKLLATAGYDGLVRVWDVDTRQPKHDLKKHKGWARAVAFSPDGTRLASAGEDGAIVLWDPATGGEVKSIAAHAGAATCLAFSPDGKPLATLAGHKDWVTSFAFSTDGSRIVSGGIDGAVKLWDTAARGEQEGPEKATSSVWTVAFAPDAASLFVGTHHGARRVATPAPKLLPPPPSPPSPPPAAAKVESAPPQHLVPTQFTSMSGGSGAIAADGTVTVTGPLAKDTYTLKAAIPAGGKVTAFRLEALADDALPQKGPGRAGNGNFVLSTFAVLAGAPGAADTPTAIQFSAARADFDQPQYGAAEAIDDKADTGWAIAGGIGQPHEAIFTVHPDTSLPAGAPLTITLDQQYADGQHALGKFRLSVVQEPTPAP